MVCQNFSARGRQPLAILLEATQHRKISLTKHRSAIPLNVARAGALFLLRASVLCHRGTGGKNKATRKYRTEKMHH
jgi:hypothetical protein